MSDFLKKFLLEDARRFSPTGRFVALAAFGKHPGWDDHVEDLGLETESLNFAKLMLYVNGIGGQIDSGAWEKLDPAQQLPGFKHLFVWQRAGQILIGRMWSSSDGKGRKRYPMVVCFHFMGVSLGWALKQALPALADLETGCLGTNLAADVRSLLARKRAALREAIQSADGKGEYAPVSPDALNDILRPADQTRVEGFLRVLYQIESQLGGFSPGVFNVKTGPGSVRVQQIRVPGAAPSDDLALLFWTRFLLVYVDSQVPLLLTLPLETDWIDITVGEPESHELFCLRATPKAVPKVSEVPYKLDDQFRAKAQAFLDGFRKGDTARPDLKPAPAPVAPAPKTGKTGFLKWLGVGSVVVVAAVVAVLMLPKMGNQSEAPGPAASKTSRDNTNLQNVAAPQPDSATAAANAKSQMEAQAEVARLAEGKKKSDAVAAAARLKAETEAAAKDKERQLAEAKEKERQLAEAAAKEKERQVAEAAAKEKERLIAEVKEKARLAAAETARVEADKQAAQKALLEQQHKDAELAAAKTQSADPATAAKVELASAAVPSPATTSTVADASANGPVGDQVTNTIGMVLVSLPSGMWVGKYEVTQGEYSQVMKANPSKWLNDRQPVEQVTWNEAVEFTHRLNQLEKSHLPAGKAYSLPTEKQWKEFSADQKFEQLSAGTASRKDPSPVGQSNAANKFGLFDVLGNVWEWCLDDAPGGQKLLKGGAFNSNNYDRTLAPDLKSLSCGFRCILTSIDNH